MHARDDDGRRRDAGSMAVVTVLVALALTSAVLTALVPWVHDLGARHRAQTAADAAALAGVTGGRAGSVRLAAANDGSLVSWRIAGDDVIVTVEVDGRLASARATDGP